MQQLPPRFVPGINPLAAPQPQQQVIGSGWVWEEWGALIRIRFTRLGVEHRVDPTQDAHYQWWQEQLEPKPDLIRLHDLLHLLLSEWCSGGRLLSPVTLASAYQQDAQLPLWQRQGEEQLVLAFARFLQTHQPVPALAPLVLAGADPEEGRKRFLELLESLERHRLMAE